MAIVYRKAENASNPFTRKREGAVRKSMGLSQFSNCHSGQVPGSHKTPQIAELAPFLAGGPEHGTFPTRHVLFSMPIRPLDRGWSGSVTVGQQNHLASLGPHWCNWRFHLLCIGSNQFWLYLFSCWIIRDKILEVCQVYLHLLITLQNLSLLFYNTYTFPNPYPFHL